MARHRVLGISFDHIHMGDLLRLVADHPDAEIAGIYDPDPARMQSAIANFAIPPDRVFTDLEACLATTAANLAIVCSKTAEHANTVEKIAPHGLNVLVEKPFAASVADARRMIAATENAGKRLAINWPLAWYPPHVTAKRLIDEGAIGDVREVHYYDGNRGPCHHLADKVEVPPDEAAREKSKSWFYQKAKGGGSLQDYLGYGATLGTWFQNGRAPIDVTAVTDDPPGLDVDEHSVTIARYPHGLSTFQTRWGTFTDPWTHQPQPACGFVITGTAGTIASYDYAPTIRLQTRDHPAGRDLPVDRLDPPFQNPVQYLLHRLDTDLPVTGPLSPELSRIGQQIVDTAARSAAEKRTLTLLQQ
jgi:glucose-fructose oxidoreductase